MVIYVIKLVTIHLIHKAWSSFDAGRKMTFKYYRARGW